MPKNNKIAVIVIGDMHINSTLGLCMPTVQLDDKGSYNASPGQSWLWNCWMDFIEWIRDNSKGYKKILIINGDAAEIDLKNRSCQLITQNPATVLRMAGETLEPIVNMVDWVVVNRGTEAHTGKNGAMEEAIAQDCRNIIKADDEYDIASFWHFRREISGVRFDVSHHTNTMRLPWTEKNMANKLAAIIINRYAVKKQELPNIVLRNHVHQLSDSGLNYKHIDLRALTLPAWQLITAYGYRLGLENVIADIGGALVLCENGEYDLKVRNYESTEDLTWKELSLK